MGAKAILTLIFVFIMTKLVSQPKSHIGASINEFKEQHPKMQMQRYEDEVTYSDKVNISGLTSSWSYRFKRGTLEWIYLHKYINEVNQDNFDKCLEATKKIIKDFSKVYGEPDKTDIGNTTYIDPFMKRHWGYDVIRAVWLNHEGMKIKTRFTFKGGKGDYSFLISIDFHDKDYPF